MSRRQKHRLSSIALRVPRSLTGILFLGFGLFAGYVICESQTPKIFASSDAHPKIQVCFSPEGNCEKLAIEAIKSAKTQILVQTYSFTSPTIAQALIDAHNRGIKIKILFDKSQLTASHSRIPELQKAGIPTKVDKTEGIAHNKIILIDHTSILTGSYNWTRAANSRNAENLLLIQDPSLAHIYEENWLARNQR